MPAIPESSRTNPLQPASTTTELATRVADILSRHGTSSGDNRAEGVEVVAVMQTAEFGEVTFLKDETGTTRIESDPASPGRGAAYAEFDAQGRCDLEGKKRERKLFVRVLEAVERESAQRAKAEMEGPSVADDPMMREIKTVLEIAAGTGISKSYVERGLRQASEHVQAVMRIGQNEGQHTASMKSVVQGIPTYRDFLLAEIDDKLAGRELPGGKWGVLVELVDKNPRAAELERTVNELKAEVDGSTLIFSTKVGGLLARISALVNGAQYEIRMLQALGMLAD